MISIIRSKQLRNRFAVALALTAAILLPLVANAQKYEVDMKNSGGAIVIEQPQPGHPGGNVRKGQEGWVRMSFVVTADGRAIDPIIIDSSGGAGFEREAREAISTWRFESTESVTESPYNTTNIRSEIRRSRNAATSNFMRRYRRIMTHLYNEENEHARKMADSTYDLGGWNLYESTMLWLMLGRVEGVAGSEKTVAGLAERAEQIENELIHSDIVSANVTITNPCNCDDGRPLWHYAPTRRTFSFANLNGNVEEGKPAGQTAVAASNYRDN